MVQGFKPGFRNLAINEIWAATWIYTDPCSFGLFSDKLAPEYLGNVNVYKYVKPMVHVKDCAEDGGYEWSSASDFISNTGCPLRFPAITSKIMELPVGKRVLELNRYSQGDMFTGGLDTFSGGDPSPWADNEGIIVKADVIAVAQKLYDVGCRPSQIVFDSPPGEGNEFGYFWPDLNASQVKNIINNPKADQPWNGSASFNDLYSYDGEYLPLDFTVIESITASSRPHHPQLNRSYLYWDRACTGIQNQFLNTFLAEPLAEIFNITKISNTGSLILKEDTFVYDISGHPYMLENLVGDATSPFIFGGWGMPNEHGTDGSLGVWKTDLTKLVRYDWGQDNGGTWPFNNTAWNQFLMNIQKLRGTKRESPNNPMRPWIAPLHWVGGGLYATDLTEPGLYWEQIRHALLAGSDSLMYFNQNVNSNNRIVDDTKLNEILTTMNTLIGGYTPHSTNTARISFLADYVISGSPTGLEGTNHTWRVTSKPGITLLDAFNQSVSLDADGGFWAFTTTAVPPVFH